MSNLIVSYLVIVCAALLCMLCGVLYQNSRLRDVERMTTQQQRKKYVEELIADGITEVIDNLRVEHKITSHEAKRAFRQLAYYYDLRDLIPSQMSVERLKNAIKKRIKKNTKITEKTQDSLLDLINAA